MKICDTKVLSELTQHRVLIIDFGGQYTHLIVRAVREKGIYPITISPITTSKAVKNIAPRGIILSGGPSDVFEPGAPKLDIEIFKLGIPILGICYGAQLTCQIFGGCVKKSNFKEYGQVKIELKESKLHEGLNKSTAYCLMSHANKVTKLPEGFFTTASTANCEFASFEDSKKRIYGVQYHPEVEETIFGQELICNFLFKICKAKITKNKQEQLKTIIQKIKEQVQNDFVICAASGGVDSSVVAKIIDTAIGQRLRCIFIDNGLLRKNESENVKKMFKENFQTELIVIDASFEFLKALEGIIKPEEKRKIIGKKFIEIFESKTLELAKILSQKHSTPITLGNFYLAQGTIYPDVIESGGENSSTIKSHHNVGGLPTNLKFKGIIEPIRLLFKDEVRSLGAQLNLPDEILNRQPFPGPGLAIRIVGNVTKEKLEILKEADFIFTKELEKQEIKSISQYFAVLLDTKSVGVAGDVGTYMHTIVLRAVQTNNYMTAKFCKIPFDVLEIASKRIVNEVPLVNRVVYDITDKPPSTIEWE